MKRSVPLAVFSLPAIAALIALGAWQLRRLDESKTRFALLETRAALPPLLLSAMDADRRGEALEALAHRRVRIEGMILPAHAFHLYAGPGWRRLVPVKFANGGAVLVDSGEVSAHKPSNPDAAPRSFRMEGHIRLAPRRSIFDPDPDPSANIWFRFDPEAMSAHIPAAAGIRRLARFRIVPASISGSRRAIPHLQYAITWFALALVGVVMHIAFMRARG